MMTTGLGFLEFTVNELYDRKCLVNVKNEYTHLLGVT